MLTAILLSASPFLLAEGNWPKSIKTAKADILIYQPQPDSMKGNHLYSRAAVSLTAAKSQNPVFGAVWMDATFTTDRESGTCTIYDLKVLNVRFPGIDTIDPARVKQFKDLLSEEAKSWKLDFSLEELKSTLAVSEAAANTSSNLKNDPPEIIYTKKSSILILFDGDPVLKEIENAGLKRVINTPWLVLMDMKDKQYYLSAGDFWYKSSDPVSSAFVSVATPSSAVSKYYEAMKQEMAKNGNPAPASGDKDQGSKPSAPPSVVVRTHPAELIQSKGEPQYAPIQGTGLLYMTNSGDDIFMTLDHNQYFILLSGRWYSSAALTGPWSFVESDKLPADFAKIPEGSAKDEVLASVAGTPAAKDAVMDAQIPQTAAVDRKSAKCTVKWDGDPKFEKITGTDLARGMNTASTVLLYKNTYYVCDNAIWFTGKGPDGPWEVATSVPDEIQKIPPDDPAYNVKYVYIYDVQPEVVYVGYTPGYMGCYVYGPTVVYGTGYPYPPFYGPYYYPRPVTFGFSMHYNPWYGWSMGFSMSVGFVTFSVGGYHGGWWGPPMYRPPYRPPYSHYYGPRAPVYHGGGNTINIDNSKNIYVNRPDGSARPATQPAGTTRPGTRQPSQQPAGTKNNVYTDRNGNVYRDNNGTWQQNKSGNWENTQPARQDKPAQTQPANRQPSTQPANRQPSTQPANRQPSTQPATQPQGGSGFNSGDMNRQSQARDRGTQNSMNRSTVSPASTGGGSRPAGSGARSGGGGVRRR